MIKCPPIRLSGRNTQLLKRTSELCHLIDSQPVTCLCLQIVQYLQEVIHFPSSASSSNGLNKFAQSHNVSRFCFRFHFVEQCACLTNTESFFSTPAILPDKSNIHSIFVYFLQSEFIVLIPVKIRYKLPESKHFS